MILIDYALGTDANSIKVSKVIPVSADGSVAQHLTAELFFELAVTPSLILVFNETIEGRGKHEVEYEAFCFNDLPERTLDVVKKGEQIHFEDLTHKASLTLTPKLSSQSRGES